MTAPERLAHPYRFAWEEYARTVLRGVDDKFKVDVWYSPEYETDGRVSPERIGCTVVLQTYIQSTVNADVLPVLKDPVEMMTADTRRMVRELSIYYKGLAERLDAALEG